MKGTEVPNPRHSSVCDCTGVLTRNQSLFCDSLMLAMRIVLFLPMQSSLTSFWRSLTGLVQLIFSFPSWFHTIYCSHTFHSFLSQITICFHLDWKTWSQRSRVFRLTGTAALHCGHSFVGGILTVLLPMTNNRTRKERLSQVRTKWPLSMWSRFIRMHIFCGVKNGRLVM